MLTEDQFIEIVGEVMERHVTRDMTVPPDDRAAETHWFAHELARRLRINRVGAPVVRAPADFPGRGAA